MVLSALVSNDGGIPLIFQALPGNTSDVKHFRKVLRTFQENITDANKEFLVVIDAAGYNKETISSIDGVKWISRVPDTISEAKELKKNTKETQFTKAYDGYSIFETTSKYAEVEQRWFLVYSEKARKREEHIIRAKVKKEKNALDKTIKSLPRKKFCCGADAEKVYKTLNQKSKYHSLKLIEIKKQKASSKNKKVNNSDLYDVIYVPIIEIIEEKNDSDLGGFCQQILH